MNIGLGSTDIKRILLDLENRRRNNEEETPELPETPSESIAPAPKNVTASILDVLATQNLILVSTSKTTPVPNGKYIIPNGQVVVHDDDDGNIGVQFVGRGKFTLDELRNLIKSGLLPVYEYNQPAQGVNGYIDEPVSQGATGDCWILTGILSLTATEEGKALIKASMEIQSNGDVIVNFKGLGYSVRVTAAEIKKHDTDDIKNDPFSNGDNDMLLFELAVQKLFEEHPDLRTAYSYEEGWQGDDRYITQGGFGDDLVEWLSGNESQGISVLDKLGDPYEQADVVEWVTVPASVINFAGKEYPRPSSISFDAMFNSSKTKFSDEYIHWYNETYAPIIREYNTKAPQSLVDGLSSEETLAQLQEAYENQPCAVTFGMYVFANDTEKTAQCVDGTTFSWKYYSNNVEKGELCGHAFAVVGMTQDTITFVNPWDSTQEITMTWDEFAKLGIGRISYNKLDEIKNDDEGSEVPSVPTFQKAELAGLDNTAIARYFIANADGTYSLNEANVKADFPEDKYGKIDTPAKLKEAIAKKAEADQTSSVPGAGSAATPSVPTFQKAELAGLDNAAIARYFIANANGTYSLNEANVKADFPEDKYGKIDTPAKLKEAIAKKAEADQTSSVPGAGGASGAKGDFGTINELSNYLFSTLRSDSDIIKLKFNKGFNYEQIAETVRNKHREDFATVTKEQLKNEFIEEYNKRYYAGSAATPSVPTFQKAELAGLDNAAIARYFIANANGTYSLNEANVKADFPEDKYGKIDTPAKLKEAIAKKAEADQTSSVPGAGGAGGASGTDDNADVKDAVTQMSKNFVQWIKTSDIGYGFFGANDNINTNYSINNDGTLNITDSKAKQAFNKLIQAIKDAYPDAVSKLGEKVLKQLVSAAWMQAANNSIDKYDFGSVPFGTFMNSVISNIKNTIQNLINHPENIELLKQKPANQISGITSNLPHYKTPDMDRDEVVYLNSNGKIENAAIQTKINETKAELKKRLKAAYPYLSQSKIDSMLEKAFDDALKFANSKGKGDHNVCGMTVRIRNNNDIVMSDLVDLALRYFDIELRSSGSFGESIVSDDNTKAYNDAKAKEEADAKAAQEKKDAAEQAKYENTKSAAAEMSKYFAQWVKTSDIGYGLFGANDNINTNYSINNDGTLNITDSKAKQAFNKLIQTIKDAYPDAVSKLGENVLKQLVSAAWMQAANNSNDKYDFGSVPFGTFMDNVISNMKTIIKNLSSNPELLEFYTKTPASKNQDLTKNLTHYNTNDTYGNDEIIGYTNGGVEPADQKDLNETKADLKARIRKAYPHIDGATLDLLVDRAFTDALKKLWNGGNTPIALNSLNSKKHRINMDDLVNLALYYFDIELFNHINNNPGTTYKA